MAPLWIALLALEGLVTAMKAILGALGDHPEHADQQTRLHQRVAALEADLEAAKHEMQA